MKKRFIAFTLTCMCAALLLFVPTASHAARGMPAYVVENSCGDNNTMGDKVLIAFATYYGSTFRISEVISEVFCNSGYQVDVKFAKDVTDEELATYDAVILGSNIYIEHWNADALAFLENNKDRLDTIPIAYFCVCGLLGMNFDTKEEIAQESYVDPMYGLYDLNPVDVTVFAGAVDYRILKPKDWLLLHLMFMPRGNWTNYAKVVDWAFELQDLLK